MSGCIDHCSIEATMADSNYQLLTKDEQEYETLHQHQHYNKSKKENGIKRVIERFTLPKPTDAVGRKKENS